MTTKCWCLDHKDRETVQHIFAERPQPGSLGEWLMCRSQNAYVDRQGVIVSNSLNLAGLEKSQQLRLQGKWHFPDFVKKQRAAIGGLYSPNPTLDSSRESAPRMPEQLGLKQALRDRSAVQNNEGTMRARTEAMDRFSNQLFPCS
jgi:hypothetical protein